VAHIAARRVVSHSVINHFVATPVLSALASIGSHGDVLSFWSFCATHLSRSKEGWPGQKTEELLRRHCRKNRGSGCALLLSLVDGTRSAGGAAAWPPAELPAATDMMAHAASLAASANTASLAASANTASLAATAQPASSSCSRVGDHCSRSPSPPAPAAPAAAPEARSIACKEQGCRYVFCSRVPVPLMKMRLRW
jgi:hypothetical protein